MPAGPLANATKYTQYRISSFFLPADRVHAERTILTTVALFSYYVVQIVALFQLHSTFAVRARAELHPGAVLLCSLNLVRWHDESLYFYRPAHGYTFDTVEAP